MSHLPDISAPVTDNPWGFLRRYTNARIALGRAGVSLPTVPHLKFQYAHALARDAVHLPFDTERMTHELRARGLDVVRLHSAAGSRAEYLQRPDLGRRLDSESRRRLEAMAASLQETPEVVFAIADGLSARAVHSHAGSLLEEIMPSLADRGMRVGPIALVEQGRVAVADEVGEMLGAELVVLLIGERPGLSSPDSMGVYVTYAPQVGLTDAERNCISNIRPGGLSYRIAAHKLGYLLAEALRRRLSGVNLKDEAEDLIRAIEGSAAKQVNFLVDKEG